MPGESRHVLVTGASSGIGLAIVRHLAAEGWRVTGLARRAVKADGVASAQVDLTDMPAALSSIASLGRIDAFVHAAGFLRSGDLGNLDPADLAAMWQLHVAVPEALVNRIAPRMQAGGRIVLIGSRTSSGQAGKSQYAATKAAMLGMARSWAMELAGRGITVNVVAPGATDTPMLTDPSRGTAKPKPPPIGRLVRPEEVAGLTAYLLSPLAASITGQQINICGGASL
ncbi:MAG: SDR family NAD(P)-dependent oxidoreductase [Acetobacteraceae bacterium]|nr:SDR family NAD(P)-dependent oxidoreductase [Acetobacteraceae bacterium]